MTEQSSDDSTDHTIPPVNTLRYASPSVLYTAIPLVANYTKHRPMADEDNFSYFERLRGSTTPEDAITFGAFAAKSKFAIHWGLQSLQAMQLEPGPEDMPILDAIGQWLEYPGNENRWRVLQLALFAPKRSPLIYMGLAVGWSGGMVAPNDPSNPPHWRSPCAVNAALLTSVALCGAENRSVNLARVMDLSAALFRVH